MCIPAEEATERYRSVKWENKPNKKRNTVSWEQNRRKSQVDTKENSLENSYAVSKMSKIPNWRRQSTLEEWCQEKKDKAKKRVGVIRN